MSHAASSARPVAARSRPRVSAQAAMKASTPNAPAWSTLSMFLTGGSGAPGPDEAVKIAAM